MTAKTAIGCALAVLTALAALPGGAADEPAPLSESEIRAILALGPWPVPLRNDPGNPASGKRGAVDFVVKPFDYRHLVELVRECLKSSADSWARRRRGGGWSSQLAALTAREREVLDRVVAGKPNRVIADELAVTIKTIEWHRARIMERLQVRSLAELIRLSLAG